MIKAVIGSVLAISSSSAFAEIQQMRIVGFQCDGQHVVMQGRTLESDFRLVFSQQIDSEVRYREFIPTLCESAAEGFTERFAGKVLALELTVDRYQAQKTVEIPPRNPCLPGRHKCDDEWRSKQVPAIYERTLTYVSGHLFSYTHEVRN